MALSALSTNSFTLLASCTIGYMLVFLVPDLFDDSDYKRYYTVVDNAAGIVPKTHVRTNGVTVGKVADITLEASQTRLALDVDASVKIPEGSTVEIRTRGLLGETFIEIVRAPDTGKEIKIDCTKMGSGAYSVPSSVEELKFETKAKFDLAIEFKTARL